MILAKLPNSAMPGGLVWLASYPKSGNTWLRIFLYHITRIMRGVEMDGNDLNHLDRSSLYEARTFSLFAEIMGKPIIDSIPPDIVAARPKVHEELARRAKTLLLLKTHMALAKVMNTPCINVDVTLGAIYVVRNPLDVVLSLSDHLGLPTDDAITVLGHPGFYASTDTEEVYEPWGSWSENVESWTGNPPKFVHVIRYEDMHANPIKTFRSVTDHLRQNPSPAQLAEAIELSSFNRLRDIESESNFRERSPNAERFFRVGKTEQWRETLTEEQIGKIVSTHYRQMYRFGYLLPEFQKYLPGDPKFPKPYRQAG